MQKWCQKMTKNCASTHWTRAATRAGAQHADNPCEEGEGVGRRRSTIRGSASGRRPSSTCRDATNHSLVTRVNSTAKNSGPCTTTRRELRKRTEQANCASKLRKRTEQANLRLLTRVVVDTHLISDTVYVLPCAQLQVQWVWTLELKLQSQIMNILPTTANGAPFE